MTAAAPSDAATACLAVLEAALVSAAEERWVTTAEVRARVAEESAA